VIQDNMGHDQTTGALNPRGILNATLLGGNGDNAFVSWKVAGKAGGQSNIDPVRGAYNEGGLTAERLGWHLPGFDDSEWAAGSPGEGFAEAGAKFYRSEFALEIPRGFDVSLAFELAPGVERSALRAQLYVNGYMFGEYSTLVFAPPPPSPPSPWACMACIIAGCFGCMWAPPVVSKKADVIFSLQASSSRTSETRSSFPCRRAS
jgi:hypothetical protein